MCRAQPGPRCPAHTRNKLNSLLATRTRIDDRITAATPGSRAWEKAIRAREHNDDDILLAHTDLNSAPSRRAELEDDIAARAAENPDDPQLRVLARDLATGRLLHAERLRQQRLMPPIDVNSCDPAAREAWLELGEARADMARYKIRMDVNGSEPDVWLKWRDRHAEAAQRAQFAAAQFDAIDTDGPGAWAQMTAAERDAARAKINSTADFTTPAAPQPLEEVFNDYIDQQGGHSPTIDPDLVNLALQDAPDPDIDSRAWAEARARSADGDANYSNKQKTPPGYAGRRAARRRRALKGRQAWLAVRRSAQTLEAEKLTAALRPASGQGSDPDKAAISDPSGMMLLLALFTRRR